MAEQLKAVAGALDITIDAKTDRTITLTYAIGGTPVDLTNYTEAAFVVRKRAGEPDPAELTLTVTGGGITLGGVAGTVAITFTDTQLDLGNKSYVYSLVLTNASGGIVPLLKGKFIVVDRA